MTESSTLWPTVRRHLAPYGRVVRIENRAGKGTPDVHYTIRGRSGWIELKHLGHWPVGEATCINLAHYTVDQIVWMAEEIKHGGRAWLLLQAGPTYVLADYPVAAVVQKGRATRLLLKTHARVFSSNNNFPTREIVKCLIE